MSEYELERGSDARALPKRLALLRPETPARRLDEHQALVTTAPHLLLREVILVQAVVVVLAFAALFFDAPLEGIADPLHTPNPAKAPWYFVGLQELLHYFPPVVAGVLLPTLVVIALVVIPYFRINAELVGFYEGPHWRRTFLALSLLVGVIAALLVTWRVWPVLAATLVVYALLALPALPFCPDGARRRLGSVPFADWVMLWFVSVAVVLTVIGVFFRGAGWSWVWPWQGGAG